MELPYDPAIPLLGIHAEETRIERDTCTPVFIAALFTIARTWKKPRYPLADEWIRKLRYIYTMEYSVLSSVVQSCPTLCDPMDCEAHQASLSMQKMRASFLGWEDPRRNDNPLQYSCLGNLMDRGPILWMGLK